MTSSSSSSGELKLFLSADTNELDLGKITLPEWKQLKDFQSAIDRSNAIYSRLNNFAAKLQQETATQADIDQATMDSRELDNVLKEVEKLTSDIVLGTGQPSPFPWVRLTVSSVPTGRGATITIVGAEQVRARPGNSLDSLGTIDGASGTTSFWGYFVPNGNYGIITFQAVSGDVSSERISITVKGMCRGEAQRKLDADIAKIQAAASAGAILSSVMGTLIAGVLRSLLPLIFTGYGGVIGLISVLVGILVGLSMWAIAQSKAKEAIAKLKANAKPLIDNLPPCPGE